VPASGTIRERDRRRRGIPPDPTTKFILARCIAKFMVRQVMNPVLAGKYHTSAANAKWRWFGEAEKLVASSSERWPAIGSEKFTAAQM
jgi:hypothetical protein